MWNCSGDGGGNTRLDTSPAVKGMTKRERECCKKKIRRVPRHRKDRETSLPGCEEENFEKSRGSSKPGIAG